MAGSGASLSPSAPGTPLRLALAADAGRVPGGAGARGDLALGALACAEASSVVPLDRWSAEGPWPAAAAGSLGGEVGLRFAGFIDDAELFDGGLFAVNATEAVLMDPQQR